MIEPGLAWSQHNAISTHTALNLVLYDQPDCGGGGGTCAIDLAGRASFHGGAALRNAQHNPLWAGSTWLSASADSFASNKAASGASSALSPLLGAPGNRPRRPPGLHLAGRGGPLNRRPSEGASRWSPRGARERSN